MSQPIRKKHPPLGYALSTWVVSKTPHRILEVVASVVGVVHYLIASGKRRSYLANTASAVEFGPQCRPWRAFQNQVLNLLELLKAASESEHDILRRMTLHGRHHIDTALKDGKGLILATFHSGNWELSGLMLAISGYPITTIAGEQLRADWSDEVKALKRDFGIKLAGQNRGLRELYRDLGSNRVIVLHLDGDIFTSGVEVSFLGRNLMVPRGPARLSRATSAPVAFAYCRRNNRNRLHVYIEPAMTPPKTTRDERDLTQAIIRRVENCILEDPGQWCIFRNLFGDR
ncbi:MAG: lysophospholipid acyltransferase family protein [Candidatus Latescibacterota bacterium]|nr:MAG: lysophospholipid acyltransferase family protein [Candidatus Latescibacterota bacterium]